MQRSTLIISVAVLIVFLVSYKTGHFEALGTLIGGVFGGWLASEGMSRRYRDLALFIGGLVGAYLGWELGLLWVGGAK